MHDLVARGDRFQWGLPGVDMITVGEEIMTQESLELRAHVEHWCALFDDEYNKAAEADDMGRCADLTQAMDRVFMSLSSAIEVANETNG